MCCTRSQSTLAQPTHHLLLFHPQLKGVITNLQYLTQIIDEPRFAAGDTTTKFLTTMPYHAPAVEVLQPGLFTTVQDWPGRVAYWNVGVPPSGPMDATSHRFANALVGNEEDAAALEMTLAGPSLKFLSTRIVAVCGAPVDVTLDGKPVPQWTGFQVHAGQVVSIGRIADTGSRAYIAVSGGGFDISKYLGSKSTFVGGSFGGFQGRALRGGDMLVLAGEDANQGEGDAMVCVPEAWRPGMGGHAWEVCVLPGPQTDPDYFVPEDMATLLSAPYKVHHNSYVVGVVFVLCVCVGVH